MEQQWRNRVIYLQRQPVAGPDSRIWHLRVFKDRSDRECRRRVSNVLVWPAPELAPELLRAFRGISDRWIPRRWTSDRRRSTEFLRAGRWWRRRHCIYQAHRLAICADRLLDDQRDGNQS